MLAGLPLVINTMSDSHRCHVTVLDVSQAQKILSLWMHCVHFSILKFFNSSKCVLIWVTYLNLCLFASL